MRWPLITFFQCTMYSYTNCATTLCFWNQNYLLFKMAEEKTEKAKANKRFGEKVLYEKFWDTVCNEMKAKAWKITA